MRITFVSNYINHHQIPLCEALYSELGADYTFIETENMDEERIRMGWNPDNTALPYLCRMEEEPDEAARLIRESEIVLAGWAPSAEDLITARLEAGGITFRISERIYKEGQWRAISPRGLVAKYRQFGRFRDKPYYLLTAGAYVASDYALVRAFPDKMLRWGYFPPLRVYKDRELERIKRESSTGGITEMVWAGRFVDFKNPGVLIRLVHSLAERNAPFHMNIVGGGDGEEEYRRDVRESGLDPFVTFHGFLPPERVRDVMERCRIMVMTSDHGEGWGAVLNEAMNSGCAIVAGSEAGAVPFLVKNGVNGYIYNRMHYEDMLAKVIHVLEDPDEQVRFGAAGHRAIRETWNADIAAARLLKVCRGLLDGRSLQEMELPTDGPMSVDPVCSPFLTVPEMKLRR